MRIKIVHLSDLELNPTLTGLTAAILTRQDKIEIWDWLFTNAIDLLDRINKNKKEGELQLLLISGDVVKGYSNRRDQVLRGWDQFYKKLHEVAEGGTQIILTTGSHDTRAIKHAYPRAYFYNSNHEHNDAPWRVITTPSGERLDLCGDEISIIGYGDLDGVRGRINYPAYNAGLLAFAQTREDLVPRFVIGMSPDHRPSRRQWAGYNIYNYIATGGAEGHYPAEHQFLIRGNDYFVYSKQGRPYKCVGFSDPLWKRIPCSFTYGIVDTQKRIATFKDLSSDTPVAQFSVEGGYGITY